MGLSPTDEGSVGLGAPPLELLSPGLLGLLGFAGVFESLSLEQDAAMRENARNASAATPPHTSECCFRELFH